MKYAIHEVLDHGHVTLYNVMADDLSVVNSARVSFNTRHEHIEEGDEGLINFLMKNRHGTPFEHNAFCFDIKAPIFIFREWQRHRIGSFNEMSARYTELPGEWYIPTIDDIRRRVGKPGAYTHVWAGQAISEDFILDLNDACSKAYDKYKFYLSAKNGEGIAPEQARMFLHVNHYSQMFWTVNARSLMNFLNLRNAATAQWEIQQFAMIVETIFAEEMPMTYEAFVKNGRIAP